MAYSHALKTIIALIGAQSAIRLTRHYSGREISIPSKEALHDMHPLVVLMGLGNAEKLCSTYYGQKIRLPMEVNALMQIRNEDIVKKFRSGQEIYSIALEYQIDRKMVQKILDNAGLKEERISRSMSQQQFQW